MQLASGHLTTCWEKQLRHLKLPIMDKEQEREDTQAKSGRVTAAPAPAVRLLAEDIAAIALTVAQVLQRQEVREPTSGVGGMESPSKTVRIDPPHRIEERC